MLLEYLISLCIANKINMKDKQFWGKGLWQSFHFSTNNHGELQKVLLPCGVCSHSLPSKDKLVSTLFRGGISTLF